jgi:heptosyltransferase-1
MKVLIVKLSSFGDVIHTFPAVSDLAAARPGVEIDWLVDESFAPMVRLHPAVDEVHAVAWRKLRWPPSRWPGFVGGLAGLRRRLTARRYDHVVDLQGLMKSALAARLAGFPVSGYDGASAREPAATGLYRHRHAVARGDHAVERSRQLLAAAVGYSVPAGPGRFGLAVPPRPDIPGLPASYVLVAHAASWPTKLWPEERWRALLARLAGEGRAMVLPWGNETEKARAERLAAGVAGAFVLPRVLAGAELAGVIGHADRAVGLDSGLMHLAAALGVPGVWLFGPTDPGLTGPYGAGQTVVQSSYPEAPCRRRACDREPGGLCCMSAIAVEAVAAAVEA